MLKKLVLILIVSSPSLIASQTLQRFFPAASAVRNGIAIRPMALPMFGVNVRSYSQGPKTFSWLNVVNAIEKCRKPAWLEKHLKQIAYYKAIRVLDSESNAIDLSKFSTRVVQHIKSENEFRYHMNWCDEVCFKEKPKYKVKVLINDSNTKLSDWVVRAENSIAKANAKLSRAEDSPIFLEPVFSSSNDWPADAKKVTETAYLNSNHNEKVESSFSDSKDTSLVIILPDSKILADRLGYHFEHFLEKTNLHIKLGGTQKAPLGVVAAIDLAIHDYGEIMKDPMITKLMQMNKPGIIKAILRDSPEALKQLKDLSVIK